MTRAALAATCLVCMGSGAVVQAAERPAVNLDPATPEQVLNHHLVRSARLGPETRPAGRVELTPWRMHDDVVEGWDWSLPPGVEPAPRRVLVDLPGFEIPKPSRISVLGVLATALAVVVFIGGVYWIFSLGV